MGNIETIIVKATERCNLKCIYCHMERKSACSMSPEKIKDLLQRVADYRPKRFNINWSGGEPLLLSDEFYESVREQETTLGLNFVTNSIQTNGLLLTPERAQFLSSLGFKVGVSFDGTLELQTANRGFGDQNTAERIYRNLRGNERNLNNVIAVLTKKSLGQEQKIFENLRRVTRNASVNLYIPTGSGRNYQDELLPTPEEMGHMLLALYELWKNEEGDFMLSPFVRIVESMVNPNLTNICEYSAEVCSQIVSVTSNGDIYFCARGTHMPDFFMGNISSTTFEELESHPLRERVIERREKLRGECSPCIYFDICNGGCPQESLTEGDFFGRTYYCHSKFMLFEKIKEDVEYAKSRLH